MASDPQLFRVTPESQETHRLDEVEFADLGLREVQDIQEWVAANPSILGDDLLIIAKELSEFDRTKERLDLLAVDFTGALVIIELKRDDSGADVHWQAIKYASYLRDATPDFIVQCLADYAQVSMDEAAERLLRHLGAEELSGLNHDQRIILASHRFAPEVTSAALWLNDKTPGDALITCVTLTPFRDHQTDVLYVQANTIIPVPATAELLVGIGNGAMGSGAGHGVTLGEKLRRSRERNRNDTISDFCWDVAERVLEYLPAEVCPNKTSRWANGSEELRFFNFWYSRPPWMNHDVNYCFYIFPANDPGQYHLGVSINLYKETVEQAVLGISETAGVDFQQNGNTHQYTMAQGEGPLDDQCAQWVADELLRVIQIITPVVDALADEGNETDV